MNDPAFERSRRSTILKEIGSLVWPIIGLLGHLLATTGTGKHGNAKKQN
jgi:hypothetical protein